MSDPKGNLDIKYDIGPLKPYLSDPEVSEIMINRYDRVFVEKKGKITEISTCFESAGALERFAQAVAVAGGRELNRKNPCVDCRMPDGSRLSIIIPPVAVDGPIITIRKHNTQVPSYSRLVRSGTADDKMMVFLYQLVRARQNLVVSGGTGSGKTTLLNVLSSFIPDDERIITIEDTAELSLQVRNLVRMESKPPMGNDPGVSVRQLMISALRMRPDRIVIGECRGAEAWDMLLAMNTGHDGSMTTMHSNSAYDSLRRLEAMILRSGFEAPLQMVRTDIASTINFVVHMDRSADGHRRIVEVTEVIGQDGDSYDVREIFKWTDEAGFHSTGVVPTFIQKNPNLKFPPQFFASDYVYKPTGS
jgi:pilus assembly protein CpaF